MPFPIIPILAIAAIVGGSITLRNHYRLTPAERDQANRLALHRFKKAFEYLAEAEQQRVIAEIKNENRLNR